MAARRQWRGKNFDAEDISVIILGTFDAFDLFYLYIAGKI